MDWHAIRTQQVNVVVGVGEDAGHRLLCYMVA
jgi:hypothetical protein